MKTFDINLYFLSTPENEIKTTVMSKLFQRFPYSSVRFFIICAHSHHSEDMKFIITLESQSELQKPSYSTQHC